MAKEVCPVSLKETSEVLRVEDPVPQRQTRQRVRGLPASSDEVRLRTHFELQRQDLVPDNPGRPCFESYPTSRAARTHDGPASPTSERPSKSRSRGSRFAGRCNPYRTGDGDDDGKCPQPSFPPVARPAQLVLYVSREGRDKHYGNTPHNRRIALPIRRRRLLLEQQARVKTEAARGFARRCRKEHPHEKAGSSRKSEEGQGEG